MYSHDRPEYDRPQPVDRPTLRFVGRKVDSVDLVGAHEIAQRLGVKRPQVVHEWRRRHADFPEPVATLKTALIWNWRDVERWANATGRL